MKHFIFSILAILVLTTAGTAFAQSANTSAPGPTIQKEPGMTNNNLPNPGNPLPQEQGAVKVTATETVNNNQDAQATGNVTATTTVTTTPPATAVETTTQPTAVETTTQPTAVATDTETLPATASKLPLLALIGLLSLAGAAVARRF